VVSGVAALVLAVNPSLSAQSLVTLLEANSDQVGGAGFSQSFGWGRVNAYRAMSAAGGVSSAPPVTISVSPSSASLSASQGVQFYATVGNTSNTAVTWSMSPSVGTLSSGGWYVAPTSISSTQTITITATSVADPTKRASAAVTLTAPPVSSPPSPSPGTAYHINAGGGGAYTDANGVTWSADAYWSSSAYPNDTCWTAYAIANTNNPLLYDTCRWGLFTYTFPVVNGNYTVTLKFAELYMAGAGQRVFNVAINGTPVLSNFDIFAQAGGAQIALDKSFAVSVSNGQIQIQFTAGAANWPTVNGIDIKPGSPVSSPSTPAPGPSGSTTLRINAGGSNFTDPNGNV
jgi:hypothetical protein